MIFWLKMSNYSYYGKKRKNLDPSREREEIQKNEFRRVWVYHLACYGT